MWKFHVLCNQNVGALVFLGDDFELDGRTLYVYCERETIAYFTNFEYFYREKVIDESPKA